MISSFRVIVAIIAILIGIQLFLYRDINREYNESNIRYLEEVLHSAWNRKADEREFDVIANLGFIVGTNQDTNLYWCKYDDKNICGIIKLDSFSCYPELEYRVIYDILYENKALGLDDLYDLCIMSVVDENLRSTISAIAVIDSMDNVVLVSNDIDLKNLNDKRINRTNGFIVGYKYNHRLVLYAQEIPIYKIHLTSMLMVICFSLFFFILSCMLLCSVLSLNKNVKSKNRQLSYIRHEVVKPLTMLAKKVEFIAEKENNTNLVDVKNYIEKVINASYLFIAADSEFNVNKEECDIKQIINAVIKIYGSVYRNVEWSVNVDKRVGKQFLDKNGVSVLVGNIVDNAIKYNDKAIPEISISCVRNDSLIEIKIADNGPGIEKPYLQKIFLDDFRIPTHINKSKTGMGMGLALAKKIVKAHGGKVWAESVFGKGTIIVAQLPIIE